MEEKKKKFTDKERRFIEEYTADFNGAQAAIRAGYSRKTARVIACQNLAKLSIREAIDARLDLLSMSAGEVTKRLTDWGRGSIKPFMRDDPKWGLVLDLTSDEAKANLHLVRKIKQSRRELFSDGEELGIEYTTEIDLVDAKDAVIQMAKVRGQFVQNINHSGEIKGKLEGMTNDQLDEVINRVLAQGQ